jgi:CRP-like cAMP-binding protein
LTQGDLVGELSFIDDTPHAVSAMSLGDSSVLQFNADDVRPLINEHPQLMFDFMRAIIKRVHHTVSDLGRQQAALSNYIYNSGKKGG